MVPACPAAQFSLATLLLMVADAGDVPVSLSPVKADSLLLPGTSCAGMCGACMLLPVGERCMLRVTLVRRGLLRRRREEGELANSRTTGMSESDIPALYGVLGCPSGQAAVCGGVLAALSCAIPTCPESSSADIFMLIAHTDGGVETPADCSRAFGSCWQDDGALGLHIVELLCSCKQRSCYH